MTELEKVKVELKSKLLEYMDLKGVKRSTGQNFHCPNTAAHIHGDRMASASFWRDGYEYRFMCHTCNFGFDIFNMAAVLDNLPLRGSAFVTQTIPELCKMLGISFNISSLNEGFKKRITNVKVNETIVKFITRKTDRLEGYLKQRGLTMEDSAKFLIGCTKYAELYTHLRKTHSEEQIASAGVGYGPEDTRSGLAKQLFHDDRLLFAVCDPGGSPVGFAGRDMLYEEKKANKNIQNLPPKYLNTQTTAAYKKSAAMYLIDLGIQNAKISGELYIFEGYTDAVTAQKYGLTNSAALGGVSFSEDHLTILSDHGIRKTVLCLDSDETGQDKMVRTVEKIFKNNRSMLLELIILPEGKDDPDSMIKAEGLAAFMALKKYNLIQYIIHTTFEKNTNGLLFSPMDTEEDRINKFMQWLSNYSKQPLVRRKAIELLAVALGRPMSDLWEQFEWIKTVEDDNIAAKADKVWGGMISEGKRVGLNEKILLLENTQVDLFKFTRRSITGDDNDYAQELSEMEEATIDARFQMMTSGYERMDKHVPIPKNAAFIGVGGYPNHGKSAYTRNLAMSFVEHNPEVMVIYCTLDDPKSATIPAFIANMMDTTINNVKYPSSISIPEVRDEVLIKVRQGFENMRRLAIGQLQWNNRVWGQLLVKDTSEIASIVDVKRLIEVTVSRPENSGKQIVLFVDSLHSFMDVGSYGGDARANIMDTAQQLKRISARYGIPVISVLEFNKSERGGNKKPTLNSISETIRIEYLLDLGIVIWNDLQARGERGTKFMWTGSAGASRYPYLELDIQKNKLGYFKGSIFMKFNPERNQLKEITASDQRSLIMDGDKKESNNY